MDTTPRGTDREFAAGWAHAGTLCFWIEGSNEDGPCTQKVEHPGIEVETRAGGVYVCSREFKTVNAAAAYLRGLRPNFEPSTHPDFVWLRNSYGSRAYQLEGDEEDEICRERALA
jgi:hypothetical protein